MFNDGEGAMGPYGLWDLVVTPWKMIWAISVSHPPKIQQTTWICFPSPKKYARKKKPKHAEAGIVSSSANTQKMEQQWKLKAFRPALTKKILPRLGGRGVHVPFWSHDDERSIRYPHRINGRYVPCFLLMFMVNAGKYAIHWSCGYFLNVHGTEECSGAIHLG